MTVKYVALVSTTCMLAYKSYKTNNILLNKLQQASEHYSASTLLKATFLTAYLNDLEYKKYFLNSENNEI